MKSKLIIALLITIPLLLEANYTLVNSKRTTSKIDLMPKNVIADMKNIPQDPAYYANQIDGMSHKKQLKLDKEYNKKFFAPWSMRKMDETRSEMEWPFRSVTKRTIYDANYRVIGASTYNSWIKNANFDKLDSVHQRAITTRHCNVHALPTGNPFYRDPKKTGEGFPFDYNQNSSYHINTPLYVSHYSLDKKWAFVRGSAAYGWIHVSSIAIVDSKFIKEFKNDNYAVVVRDNLKLKNAGKSLTIVKLGSIFPMSNHTVMSKEGKKVKTIAYLFATRDTNGMAKISRATVSTRGLLAKKPIAFTAKNVALITKQFYNEPYGWGGLLETRDCSSMTKDYFSVFGIFLRRNSSKQARDGQYINIKKFKKANKKKVIKKYAEPFRSLLFVPGHIVLYLGQYKGEPVIMHTYWGTRLKDGSKHILARNVITTTEPGKELSNIKESSKLANTLRAIVNFGD
jgi:cell wall-associated NlpC family hydrolase